MLTKERLQHLIELGLAPEGSKIPPPTGKPMTAAWDEMSPEDRRRSAKTMEIYAAMVEQLDENIGRVIEYLRNTGELDNTFVVFMSDNGAEGAAMEALPVSQGPRILHR